MTEAEHRLWYLLRGKRLQGIQFRRQQSIGSYIVDFVSRAHQLVIELDGGQHSEQTEAVLEVILQACHAQPSPWSVL